jgi:hypothetical protein
MQHWRPRSSKNGAGKEGGHALVRERDGEEQAGLVEGSVGVDAVGAR